MTLPELESLESRLRTIADSVLEGASRMAETKADGSLLTETDAAMQQAITAMLAETAPDIPLLGEEMTAAAQQTVMDSAGPFWVLDPIDGTSNFSAGLPFYCVSLALVESGKALLGVVYDPCRGESFTALRNRGAWLNGEPLTAAESIPLSRAIGLVDLKRVEAPLARALVEKMPVHSMRNLGAVALEWCWLAAGRGQVYLHGKQKLWDYAAAQLVLRETGGVALDLDGEPPEPLTLAARGMMAATGGTLFDEWHSWLAGKGH